MSLHFADDRYHQLIEHPVPRATIGPYVNYKTRLAHIATEVSTRVPLNSFSNNLSPISLICARIQARKLRVAELFLKRAHLKPSRASKRCLRKTETSLHIYAYLCRRGASPVSHIVKRWHRIRPTQDRVNGPASFETCKRRILLFAPCRAVFSRGEDLPPGPDI